MNKVCKMNGDVKGQDGFFQNANGSKFTIENNILKGEEVFYDSKYTTLGKFVLDTLDNNPDFVGQIDATTGEKYTYEKMRERSVRCALWMRSQGLLPGDVVTICAPNQLDIAMPCFAALYLGAVFNPLDDAMNAKDILHLMNINKPKMAFVGEESATAVAEAAKEANLDLKIITFTRVAGFLEFESIIAEPKVDGVKSFECMPIGKPDPVAVVMCSSGTTGLPKAVALSHEAILSQLLRSQKFQMTGHCLVFSSLYWISGTLIMFISLSSSVTRIIPPAFEEYSACEIMEKYQIKWIFWGSSMINRLLKSGALERYNLSHVERVYYGGAPLALGSRKAFAKSLPNALILSAYGLTELAGGFSIQIANSKPGSVGQIIENSELKVVDPNTGRILGANQMGELLLKTKSIMSHYCGNSQATAETLDEEGWLHSGDLGYYDEDGEIFVVDRLKELIKYRGYQISPIEIENVILSHPGVKEVAVVGVPHPVDDEHPLAFVVRATDSIDVDEQDIYQVTEKELVDLVAAELSESKRLHGGVRFLDHLPKSPSDKTRRKQLRDLAKSTDDRRSNS